MPTLNRDPYGYADPDWEEPFSRWQTFCFALAVTVALPLWFIAVIVIFAVGAAQIAYQDVTAAIRKRLRNAPRR